MKERRESFEIRENGHTARTPLLYLQPDGYGVFPYASEESGGLPLTPQFRVFSSTCSLCAPWAMTWYFSEKRSPTLFGMERERLSAFPAGGCPWIEVRGGRAGKTVYGRWLPDGGAGKLILLTETASSEVKVTRRDIRSFISAGKSSRRGS